MDVFCSMCETRHDENSPDVVFDPSSGEWLCADEGACLERFFDLRELFAGGTHDHRRRTDLGSTRILHLHVGVLKSDRVPVAAHHPETRLPLAHMGGKLMNEVVPFQCKCTGAESIDCCEQQCVYAGFGDEELIGDE